LQNKGKYWDSESINQNIIEAAVQIATTLKQTKEIHYVQTVIRPQRRFFSEFQFLFISFIVFLFVPLKTRRFCFCHCEGELWFIELSIPTIISY
jgi:hypothetical protein